MPVYARDLRGNVDFGILTIREDENRAILERLPPAVAVEDGRRRYRVATLPLLEDQNYTVAVVRCGEQGTTEALSAALDLIDELDPAWLLVVGIAGAVPAPEFCLGDVIVSSRIADFSVEAVLQDSGPAYALAGGPLHPDAAKFASDLVGMDTSREMRDWNSEAHIQAPRPFIDLSPRRFYGDAKWRKDVKAILTEHAFNNPSRRPRAIAGAIASSDRLIKDAEVLQVWLKMARQVQAIEMESAGVYRAAHERKLPFLAFRGVSDIVGFRRDPAWTAYACATAAAFTIGFLKARPIRPRNERQSTGVLPKDPVATLGVHPKATVVKLEIHLDGNVAEFDERKFMSALGMIMGPSIRSIRISAIRAGSVVITLEGQANEIAALLDVLRGETHEKGHFIAEMRVTKATWDSEDKANILHFGSLNPSKTRTAAAEGVATGPKGPAVHQPSALTRTLGQSPTAGAHGRRSPRFMQTPGLEDRLRKIRELIWAQPNQVLPFIGSGLSQGLPTWKDLLRALVNKIPNPPEREELLAELGKDKCLDVASSLEGHPAVGRNSVISHIKECYQRPRLPRPGTYDALVKIPVDHFVTTNYDPWLKDAFAAVRHVSPRVYAPMDYGSFSELLANSPPLVLMLHGDADRAETCVLSVEGYRDLEHGHQPWSEGMRQLVAQRQFVFVGYSLSDPDIQSLLNHWQAVFGSHGAPLRHFLLDASISDLRAQRLRKLGIDPIDYGDHSLLPEVLEELSQPLASVSAVATNAPRSVRPAHVTPPPERMPTLMMPPRPALLVGRDGELNLVVGDLQKLQSVHISGMPGVGKTSLAYEALWRARRYFEQGGIIQTTPPPSSYEEVLNVIARYLGEAELVALGHAEKEVEVITRLKSRAPLLLLLDNIEDLNMLANIAGLAGSCTVLATSRQAGAPEWLTPIQLTTLQRPAAVELFRTHYELPLSAEQGDRLCQSWGDMPLAIEIVAKTGSRLKLRPEMLDQVNREPVFRSIEFSYYRLDSEQQRRFAALSFFESRPFDSEAASGVLGHDCRKHLIDLAMASLLRSEGDDRYSLHPLLAEFGSIKLTSYSAKIELSRRMVSYFAEFCQRHRNDFPALQRELANILCAMNMCYSMQDAASYERFADAMLRIEAGHYAYGFLPQRGYWSEAIAIVERCFELLPGGRRQAALNEHLGLFYYWRGEHQKAEQYFNQALAFYRELHDDKGEVVILHRLGFLRSDEGDYAQCQALYRRSYEIAVEKSLPEETLADCIHLVGVVLYNICHYHESRRWLERALELRRGPARAVTQRRLAGTYRKLLLLDEAESLLRSSLLEDESTGNERNIARGYRQLGMVQLEKNETDNALASFRSSHEIFKRIGNKRGIAASLANLAEAVLKLDDVNLARQYLEESVRLASDLGSKYGIARCTQLLGNAAFREKKPMEALSLLHDALGMYVGIGYSNVDSCARELNESLHSVDLQVATDFRRQSVFSGHVCEAEEQYDLLGAEGERRLREKAPKYDPHLLRPEADDRLGLSLIMRPSADTKRLLWRVGKHLKESLPEFYYYSESDYHVTVTTVVAARKQFVLDVNMVDRLCQVVSASVIGQRPFSIEFLGVLAATDCVLAKGFYPRGTLEMIRSSIRKEADKIGLSLEERHSNVTAHVTLARYRVPFDSDLLLRKLQLLKSCELGVSPVREVELVVTDWYSRKSRVRVLRRIVLEG